MTLLAVDSRSKICNSSFLKYWPKYDKVRADSDYQFFISAFIKLHQLIVIMIHIKKIDCNSFSINLQSNSNLAVYLHQDKYNTSFFRQFVVVTCNIVSKVLKEWKERALLPLPVEHLTLKRVKCSISVRDQSGKLCSLYSAFLRHAPIYAAFLLLAREFRERRFCVSRYPRKLACRLAIPIATAYHRQTQCQRHFLSGILISMSWEKF